MIFNSYFVTHLFLSCTIYRNQSHSNSSQYLSIIRIDQNMVEAILCLFLLLSAVFVQDTSATKYRCNREEPCGCSAQSVDTNELAASKTVGHDSWNWVVSLRDANGHFCHASILNERYVITAAHCLEKTTHPLSDITVCAGVHHSSEPCHQYLHSVTSHPSYNNQTLENDVALIRVHPPFNFTDKHIARVCLPNVLDTHEYPPTGTDVTAVSWKTNEVDHLHGLQQVRMQVVDNSKDTCASTAINHRVQLCAVALRKGKTFWFNRCCSFLFSLFLSDRLLSRSQW